MTQEIKQKLEQAADNYRGGDDFEIWTAFYAGAQTVLDNPGEWGLLPVEEGIYKFEIALSKSFEYKIKQVRELQSQLTKYREALDKVHKIVINDLSEPIQEIIDVVEGVLYEGE